MTTTTSCKSKFEQDVFNHKCGLIIGIINVISGLGLILFHQNFGYIQTAIGFPQSIVFAYALGKSTIERNRIDE